MRYFLSIAAVTLGLLSTTAQAARVMALPGDLKEGDIIFHQSQSSQAEALEEATGSIWTHTGVVLKDGDQWMVVEAGATVKVTPIYEFIAHGKHNRFVIKRVEERLLKLDGPALSLLKKHLETFLGKAYDVFFEWSDERIYCSELVWKAFEAFFPLAEPQRMRDLKLDGPAVQKLIIKRYIRNGKQLNLEEPMVTPVALFQSEKLRLIYDSRSH